VGRALVVAAGGTMRLPPKHQLLLMHQACGAAGTPHPPAIARGLLPTRAAAAASCIPAATTC
jgi:hypothetical protein